jgi:hypothetical protein
VIRRTWVFAAIVGAAIGSSRAGRVCELAFSECPRKFSSGIVKVPNEMIWLDAKIPFCNEYIQITNGDAKPPSIVFIIDNSGSMDEFDPEEARFSVVSTLLDNIFTFAPATEVSLVIFTRRLSFDHRENPYFKTAFPLDTAQHDSFVPLTALNKTFADGRLGIDTLKAFLKHDDKGNLTYVTKLAASRNNSGMGRSNTRDGTDITLGFQAAKVAIKDSKSDKANQYFIFFSDGTPSTPDNGREAMMSEFMAGAAVPTTFTVFFDNLNSTPVAPSSIVQMTSNIKVNNYSAGNVKSAYWAINLPESQLQGLVQTQVIGNVLSLPTKPKSASLAIGDSTFLSGTLDPKNYVFTRHLAMQEDTTRFRLDFTYTYVDTVGGKQETKEKSVPYAITFVRAANAPLPTGLGKTSCRDQADIALFHEGKPVSMVTADDTTLEARLTMPDGSICRDCKMEVMPSSAKSKDYESLFIVPASGYLAGAFQREVSLTPAVGDGRLQHLPKDSIVVLYVSPENSLDRVRKAFPYTDVMTVLNLEGQNDYTRTRYLPPTAQPQFILVAPPTIRPHPSGPLDRWTMQTGTLTPEDSIRHVGLIVEASRAFTVDVRVFSNLGLFVNKLSFSVDQAEFLKLEKSPKGGTRMMKVLWDSRARNGATVGTGAYVIKTTVTLMNIPGIAEDRAVRTDYRRVGVLRSL